MLTNQRNALRLGGGLLAVAFLTWLCWALMGWWALVWTPLIALVIGLGLLIWAATRAPHVSEPIAEDPERPVDEAPEFHRCPISDHRLTSLSPDYRFFFGATVHWRPLWPGHDVLQANPAGIATGLILDRARSVTAAHAPEEYDLTRQKLTADLGVVLRDPDGRLEVWAEDISLSLPQRDMERIHSLADLRKDEDVWQRERDLERSKREYLGDDVLRDPGRAVVWWLSRDFDGIDDAARRIGLLAKLSAAANGEAIPDLYRNLADDDIDRRPYPVRVDAQPSAHVNSFSSVGGESGTDTSTSSFGTLFDIGRQHEDSAPREPIRNQRPLDHATALLDFLQAGRDDADHEMLVDRITRVLDAQGRRNLAADIREHYGVPGFDPSTDAEPCDAAASETSDRSTPAEAGSPADTNPTVLWEADGSGDENDIAGSAADPISDPPMYTDQNPVDDHIWRNHDPDRNMDED